MTQIIDIREKRPETLNFSGCRRSKLWRIVELLETNERVSLDDLSCAVSRRTPKAIQGAIDKLRSSGFVIRREAGPDCVWFRMITEAG